MRDSLVLMAVTFVVRSEKVRSILLSWQLGYRMRECLIMVSNYNQQNCVWAKSMSITVSYDTFQQIRNWQICKIPEAAGQVKFPVLLMVFCWWCFVDGGYKARWPFSQFSWRWMLAYKVLVAMLKCFVQLFSSCLHNFFSQKSWKQWMFSSTAKRNC